MEIEAKIYGEKMKSIFKMVKLLLFGLVLAALFHNWTLKTLLSFGLRLGLGAPVDIETAHLDFFSQRVTFEGIVIKNPAAFQRGILAEIPKITVDFDGSELQRARLHFREAAVEIEDLRIIRTAGGKMNLLGLKVFRPAKTGKPSFQMDKVVISLNRVTYTDLSGPNPLQQSFRLGIQKAVLENKPDLEAVVEAIVQEAIQAAGLQKVLDEGIRSFGLRNWLPEKTGWKSLVEKVKKSL
ncbi:MAG TPA: hypothetical protein VJC08_00010 [bacterium]|nr:hypothetical protein [bacterium]